MLNKIAIFVLIIIIFTILASFYGFLHNQISYTISNEYFTKFKFNQFWSQKYAFDYPRMSAGLVGIASTWWFGLLIGLVIGIIGLIKLNSKNMWNICFNALIRTLFITIITGLIGILIGWMIISNLNVNWNIPKDVINRKNFLIAGTMHDFSYLGGILGLINGIWYLFKKSKVSA